MFDGCASLKALTIPSSVTEIERSWGSPIFTGCHALERVEVDAENKTYDSRNGCNAIIETSTNELIAGCKNTYIPNTVTTIGQNSFGFYDDMTSITIPNSIIYIGDNAFWKCSNLTTIRLLADEPYSIQTRAFENRYESATLFVPSGTKNKYQTAEGWKQFANIIEMEECLLVSNIRMSESLSLVTGNTEKITPTIEPSNATDKSVTWRSSNPKVASVNADGEVTGLTAGTAYIYCIANDGNGAGATCTVHVSDDLTPTDISAYSNIVYTETATASPESTFTMPVKMRNASANISGFQFNLVLPSGVSVAKDEDGFYMVNLSKDRTTDRKHTVSLSLQDDGSLLVICYSNNNSTFSGLNGNVLEMTLQTSDMVEVGDLPIILRNVVMTTPNLDSYNVRQVVSLLTIEDYMKGDVNGDKVVNVVDVAGVVNLILNSGNTTQLNRKAADINGDNTINVVDVAGVVNIILGSGSLSRRNVPVSSGQSTLSISDFSIAQGEKKTICVDLSNAGDSFTGCQFDLYLPKGLSIVYEDGYALVDIGSRSNARKHTVSTATQADGSTRIVCYSNNNSTFSGEEGDILTITLQASADATLGNSILSMKNITLSRPDVTGISLDESTTMITIMDKSGITDIMHSAESSVRYSISGQRLDAPKRGINIVGGRKVVVK